jgi:hypothetical protein
MATIKLRQVNPVVFDNNVGLGDMNPNEKLVLNNGNIRLQSYNAGQGLIFKSTSSLGNWASIKFIQPDSTPTWQIIVDEAGNKTNDFKIVSGAATKVFHMDSIGTIGMGVNVPRSHLHIGGARGGSIALTNSTIGDGPSDGSDIYASTDEHLHIQNRQAIGGIIFRTNGNEGLFINSSQNVSVGVADLDSSEFSHLTPHSRFLIHKSGIGDNVTQGMLHLWGKFSVSTLGNGEEFLSHRVTFENSTGSIKNSFSPIQFSHNDSKIDTYLNKDNGSVKIGPGVAATENGLLEVANNGLNVVTRVRLYSNSADAYLSFGDDRQNWIVGADYSSESFVIGHVGNGTLTPSSGGALYISANNEVGIGTGSAGPSYTLEVNSGTTNEIARFASTDDDGLISVGDHNDMTYIGYDHSNTAMSLGFDNGMGATNLIIKPDGNVGIGTGSNTIGSRLHVKDSITEVARFENTTASNPVWIQLKNADGFAQIGSRAGTIELAPSGSVMATFQADGKIKVGATKQTPIRHLQDNVEANTLVPICVTEDHGNDKVIYTGSLSAIEEDDIIVCSVNFGLSDVSTDVYNPHINFALVLGKTEYSDFGDPADDYSTIIGKHTVRLTDTRTLVYGGDLTGGKTAYAKNSGYGGVASGPIANDDTTTSWKSGTGGVNWWWIDPVKLLVN